MAEKDSLGVIADARRFAGSVLILLGVLYPYRLGARIRDRAFLHFAYQEIVGAAVKEAAG